MTKKKLKTEIYLTLCFSLLIFFVIIFGLGALGIYCLKWQGRTAESVYHYLPLPVAIVDGQPISYYHYLKTVNSLTHFYQYLKQQNPNFVSPLTSEIQKEVLKRLIKDRVAKKIVKEKKIEIKTTEIDQELSQILIEISTPELTQKIINDYYCFSLNDFKKYVLLPLYRSKKIEQYLINDPNYSQRQRILAEGLLEQLKNNEFSFEDLAEKYSTDDTARVKGDLGYFGRGEMESEFEQVAFALEPGQISEVVKTKYGYHIIKVEERIAPDPQNLDAHFDGEQIKARHIFIKNPNFDKWLEAQVKNSWVIKLLCL